MCRDNFVRLRAPLLLLFAACVQFRVPLSAAADDSTVVRPETPANSPVLAERHETAAEHDRRLAWFRDARFGMFIHWGLYAQLGGVWKGQPADYNRCAEWAMFGRRIPIAEYAAEAKNFNPVKYDAEQWVLTARNAGMKYMVITAKHHEGFAMFKTAASPFNIVEATPFRRDPLKELAAACHKHGMKLGFYYSQNLDWHHPGGGSGGWDPAHKGDAEKYVDEIVIPQLREILTNYGPIDIIWFDIPGGVINKRRADRIMKVVLACQPNILINNRLGGGYHGDTETPEQSIPATGFPGRDWETCMTMNHTWGFNSRDHAWKSTKDIVRMLCDIASKGGNYLLNVGPNSLGEIPAPSVERLKEVGGWLKINGEAIYGTRANPFRRAPAWGRVTRKPGKLYLHVFDWPQDRSLVLAGIGNKVDKAYLLADANRTPLEVSRQEGMLTIRLPESAPSPWASVVVVEYSGELDLTPVLISQRSDGKIELTAVNCEILGNAIRIEGPGDGNIGYWTDVNDFLRWKVKVDQPGKMKVTLTYACQPDSTDSQFALNMGGQTLTGKVLSTEGWGNYVAVDLGEVSIANQGPLTVELKPTSKPKLAVMNLRSVVLTPIKQ